MADIYQKHMEDVSDGPLQTAMAPKELAFNRVLRRAIYKHLDGITFDYYPSEFVLAKTNVGASGAALVGVDSSTFAELVGTNSQALWKAVDTKIATLVSGQANAILKDGSVTFTANQPMAGFKLTGAGGLQRDTAGDIDIIHGILSGNINIINGAPGQGGNINITSGQDITLSSSTGVILKGYAAGGSIDLGLNTYVGAGFKGVDIWFPYSLKDANYAIIASTTQTQGQMALTRCLNIVTTVANINDVVTLPHIPAYGGLSTASSSIGTHFFIKNNGANTLQIFPAAGHKIDGGATNASITLAASAKLTLIIKSDEEWITF